jgi:GH15 family glucan-1,4-alpha-glucosidase
LTFTCGAVIGGLHAAAEFAYVFGERQLAVEYETAAREMRRGMDQHLWRPELGRFARMIVVDHAGQTTVDGTVDASLYGAFAFGAYPADDHRVEATMKAVREKLWCNTEVGGLARYQNDYYHQISTDTARVPGNPWFICTMWLAQYEVARATNREALTPALEILRWVARRKARSGVLAEQVHPFTGGPLSVAPLTWSHATVVALVQEYLDRCESLELKAPGQTHRYRKIKGYERPEPVIAVDPPATSTRKRNSEETTS